MNNNIDSVMTLSEIVNRVSVSERTVRNMCKQWKRDGKARKSGRVWLVDKDVGQRYIKQNPK